MSERFKRTYLIIMIAVPFLIYCGYYYYEMIRKAPYKFEEFETFEMDLRALGNRSVHIDFGSGIADYRRSDSLITRDTLSFSTAELQELHRTLYTNNFFDLPHEMHDNAAKDSQGRSYTLRAVYERKSYQVVYQTGYIADRRWKDKIDRIIAHAESLAESKAKML